MKRLCASFGAPHSNRISSQLFLKHQALPHRDPDLQEANRRTRSAQAPFLASVQLHTSTAANSELIFAQAPTNHPDSPTLKASLIADLNKLCKGPLIYDDQRFAAVSLPLETWSRARQGAEGSAAVNLNRELLEFTFPAALAVDRAEFTGQDVINATSLLMRLRTPTDKLTEYLNQQATNSVQGMRDLINGRQLANATNTVVANFLNECASQGPLYSHADLSQVALKPDTWGVLARASVSDDEIASLNRQILADQYSDALQRPSPRTGPKPPQDPSKPGQLGPTASSRWVPET
jgi:hypothetical protein